jgi:hypothetical protein
MRLDSKLRSDADESTLTAKAMVLMAEEYLRSNIKYGPFHSTHEAYGVLKEEVDELWDTIKANDNDGMFLEAMQVGAMALTLMISLLRGGYNEQHLSAGNDGERKDDAGQNMGENERTDLREFGGHSSSPNGRGDA